MIDTGLDVNHPEFAGQVARVFDTSSGGADVTDIVGHGTFVSGLISALDGNGRGGKGVAGTTKLIAVRASTDGGFTVGDLIGGIEFSIRRGADVINMSLAGDASSFTSTQARALEAAFFNDVLPIAAAGNNAENGNPVEFPAAAVGGRRGGRGIGLSVAATKPDGSVASFSNHNQFVSLAAPGASGGELRVRRVLDAARQRAEPSGTTQGAARGSSPTAARATPTARARASPRRSSPGSPRSPGRRSAGSPRSRWPR